MCDETLNAVFGPTKRMFLYVYEFQQPSGHWSNSKCRDFSAVVRNCSLAPHSEWWNQHI